MIMKNKFVDKVENFIKTNGLAESGDSLVIGVSGGADSLALFFSLLALKDKYRLKLYVAHVNHGLREEAAGEADYVKEICEKNGIPFYLKEADISTISKELSLGTEEAGRKVRYAFFDEILKEIGGGKIAVAHNQNDVAETMLFNLVRGTGIKGLSSIPPKRGNVIRPLLFAGRDEIEEFLSDIDVSFCTDKTNLTDEYTRNRIRNKVIPAIETNVSKSAVEHMAVTASMLRELNEYMEDVCEKAFLECRRKGKATEVVFDKKRFSGEDIYIQKCLVKRAIDELVPGNRDITHIHLESVTDLVSSPGSKTVNLPYNIKATTSYEEIVFERDAKEEEPLSEVPLAINGRTILTDGTVIETGIYDNSPDFDYGQKQYTKCFDYDKINESLVVRARNTKDVICINASGGKKKLKDFMIDEKIPVAKRNIIPIIADGNDVWWVIGHRMSEAVKITKETKKIIMITVFKED